MKLSLICFNSIYLISRDNQYKIINQILYIILFLLNFHFKSSKSCVSLYLQHTSAGLVTLQILSRCTWLVVPYWIRQTDCAVLFLILQNIKGGKNIGVTDLQNQIFKTTDSKDELCGCFLKDLINHFNDCSIKLTAAKNVNHVIIGLFPLL